MQQNIDAIGGVLGFDDAPVLYRNPLPGKFSGQDTSLYVARRHGIPSKELSPKRSCHRGSSSVKDRFVIRVSRFTKHYTIGAVNREGIRSRSKAMFGNKYRLEVAAAVGDSGGVLYARDIARILGVSDNLVFAVLKQFEEAGMLQDLGRVEGQQQHYYARADSFFWDACSRLLVELVAAPDSKQSEQQVT